MYWAAVTSPICINVLMETGTFLPQIPSFALSHFMDFLFTTLIIYLSVGTCIQYARVRLQTVNLFENLEERTVVLCMRMTIGVFSSLMVCSRIALGAYSIAFPRLMNREYDIKIKITMAMMIPLILASILVNVVLKIFISIEKRKNKQVCGLHNSKDPSIPICKYMISAIILGVVVVASLLIDKKMDLYKFNRDIQFAMAISAPLVVITRNKKIFTSAKKRVFLFFPFLSLLVAMKSRVSPPNST